jgi:DNA-binding XRE family transcriptional regulator
LDIKPALIAQQAALDDDRRLKRDIILIIQYEANATRVAQRLGVNRQRIYEWIKGKWLPRDPVIRELIKQWSNRIRDLRSPASSQS